ncbi:MAG: hypothetical protein FWF55_08250 [Treponema sp.]|nr:hypothetical protein [Treponema sp.]
MKMKKPMRKAYFVLVAVSLVCGAAIYPLFRGPNLLVWNVLPKPGFWEKASLQGKIPYEKRGFLSVLTGSGPDCLWLLSGILVLRGVWFFERKTQAAYIAVFYIIAAGYNGGQYFGIVPGTFDFLDLLTMSGVALTEGIIFTFSSKRRKKDEEDH